jgi:hypothetical protein
MIFAPANKEMNTRQDLANARPEYPSAIRSSGVTYDCLQLEVLIWLPLHGLGHFTTLDILLLSLAPWNRGNVQETRDTVETFRVRIKQ